MIQTSALGMDEEESSTDGDCCTEYRSTTPRRSIGAELWDDREDVEKGDLPASLRACPNSIASIKDGTSEDMVWWWVMAGRRPPPGWFPLCGPGLLTDVDQATPECRQCCYRLLLV